MNKRGFLKLLCGGGAVALTTGLSGCVVPYAPAPRAAAYDYYYYPDVNVYFGIATGYYYFWNRRRWWRARTLPRRFVLQPRYRRAIYVGGPRPYRWNRRHRQRYRIARRAPAARPGRARRVTRRDNRRVRRENRRTRRQGRRGRLN